jgi:enoyl-CoA hydratase
MKTPQTMTYEVTGRIARITLNRPARGNGITLELPQELAACVEAANLDPRVHVIALAGNGKGFCGGYDLVASAEHDVGDQTSSWPKGSPMDWEVVMQNHDPAAVWDPMIDYAMMSRNVRGFMSLFHGDKPVICKVHGFCVAGGTDMALCSDLLVIADDAKIGYPPARVWGVPTTAVWAHRIGIEKAKRLLFTGDCLSGKEAVQWGLATESAPAAQLDARFEALLERTARMPINQLVMMKLLVNQTVMAQGLHATQIFGVLFDGVSRHTKEGYAFQQRAAEAGFKTAVIERDQPYGDPGPSTFKG